MTIKNETAEKTDESFLSRWARVKQSQVQETPALAVAEIEKLHGVGAQNTSIDGPHQHKVAEESRPEPTLPNSQAPVELPSLDSLTPQSDFSPFMAKDVDMQLRNQAMKKLFTDPHYNVMDRLDIYIDDYSVHTPLPIEVIRQMNIAKTLGLFDDEEADESCKGATVASKVPEARRSGRPAVQAASDGNVLPAEPTLEFAPGESLTQCPADVSPLDAAVAPKEKPAPGEN